MAQFSEFTTTIPEMENGFKQQQPQPSIPTQQIASQPQIQSYPLQHQQQKLPKTVSSFQNQSSPPTVYGQTEPFIGSGSVNKVPKLPKQAGGIDRLLDSIGFYGIDRSTFKLLRNAYPSEMKRDEVKFFCLNFYFPNFWNSLKFYSLLS